MYTHIWNKYLPVVRILLKRAVTEEQNLQLNVSDFKKAGEKKNGFNFTLKINKGRVENPNGLSVTAKEFFAVLLQDRMISELFQNEEYLLNLNSKYLLGIKHIPKAID